MKKIITYGTFDLFHEGHRRIIQRAKALGDYLVVGVTTEQFDISRGKMNVADSLMRRIEFADEYSHPGRPAWKRLTKKSARQFPGFADKSRTQLKNPLYDYPVQKARPFPVLVPAALPLFLYLIFR